MFMVSWTGKLFLALFPYTAKLHFIGMTWVSPGKIFMIG
jgi:hypothetical protein